MNPWPAPELGWTALLWLLTLAGFALPLLPALLASRKGKAPGALFIDPDDNGSAAYAAARQQAARQALEEQGAPALPDAQNAAEEPPALGVPVEQSEPMLGADAAAPSGSALQPFVAVGPDVAVPHAITGISVHVLQGTQLQQVVSAQRSLLLEAGSRFVWLDAPTIQFGHAAADATPAAQRPPGGQGLALPAKNASATGDTKGAKFQRVEGDLTLTAGDVSAGDRLVTGDLRIGDGATVQGSFKVYGQVWLGAAAWVGGSMFAEGSVVLGPGSCVLGLVSSSQTVELGAGCVVGAPEQLSSVAAQVVQAASGAVVHGGVRARRSGLVCAATGGEALA